jgi:hypothetical protein
MKNASFPATAEGMPKISPAEVIRQAWADYRRDVKMGWGPKRNGPFDRKHFAYCLRMAWAVAKQRAADAAKVAPATPARAVVTNPVAIARATEIRSELQDMEFGSFINWDRRRDLSAELSRLGA